MKYDYLIVGAGLAGCMFAYLMNKNNKKCLLIEKRNVIGGNVYCDDIEGIEVHKYGAHIFRTDDKKVWDMLNEITEFNNFINSPLANYKGEIYNLPFNMNTFNKIWDDVITPDQAKNRIELEKFKGNPKNLEEKAISLVGKTIYEKLVKGYTEKQWGRKCTELPASILKRIPVRFTYNNNYFNQQYQGIPKKGYNYIFEKLVEGSDVILNEKYNKQKYKNIAKKVVYTGALDELFDYCYGELEYRTLRFENKILDMENFQGNAVVNYTDVETPYTRIIEHKHFKFGKQPKTVITYEYPEKWDKTKDKYYPINDDKNNELYKKYLKLAKQENNLLLCGRLAEYKYYDMDDIIHSVLNLIEKELN